eukprot:tig00020943_g16263.t1
MAAEATSALVIESDDDLQVTHVAKRPAVVPKRRRIIVHAGPVDLDAEEPQPAHSSLDKTPSVVDLESQAPVPARRRRAARASDEDVVVLAEKKNPNASPMASNTAAKKSKARERRVEKSFECPICLDSLRGKELSSTICVFCTACLFAALDATQMCPTCRKRLKKSQTHKLFL